MIGVWQVEVFFVVYLQFIECVWVLILIIQFSGIVLWEQLCLLNEVDGLQGNFWVLCNVCMLNVINDYEVVQVWLVLYEIVVIQCVYCKEVVWLILWVIVECGWVLLFLIMDDVIVYWVFVWYLILCECWVGLF